MAKKSGSEDKSFEALEFLINVLKKHEQILDKSIQELATLTEYLEYKNALYSKVENAEDKINIMQKEVTSIIGEMPNVAKEALQAPEEKKQEPEGALTQSLAEVQSGLTLFLNCKRWGDFEALAMHAQILSFSYEENEQTLQASALKGEQVVKFTGAFPDLSIILKAWLACQLNVAETNIMEGFWGHPE
jgi:hypothetical protein